MTQIINFGSDTWNAVFHGRAIAERNTFWSTRDLSEVYFKGDITALLQEDRLKILIVGSRDMKPETGDVVRLLVGGLADKEIRDRAHPAAPVIISGLGIGVDGRAHELALKAGLPTVGVMATGLDTVYPHYHRELAEQMLTSSGCGLLTQFRDGTAPDSINFLDRTKTMVLMSDIVIVASCKKKGSPLVAARYANDVGVPVLAVPGRLSDFWHEGCNTLIKNGMAKMLTDVADIYDAV